MALSKSFVLKSIEVKNWKTFAEATLNVKEEGLTGIVGKNGSGKSSFVDAIIWCLYGNRPKDVVKSSLRRRKSDPLKDETVVKVTFTHAGQIVEVFRKMKGKNSTVTGGIFLDGVVATIATGGTVESWITNRLGMDAQGFRTAIVVPQKELDVLVDNIPSVRREHIERLAGVEDMNLAVQKARKEENELANQIKVLPGSVDDVAIAEQHVETLTDEFNQVEISYSNLVSESSNFEQEFKVALDESSAVKEEFKKANSIYGQINNCNHNIQLQQNSAKSLENQINAIAIDIDGIDVTRRAELETQYRTVNEEFIAVNHELANYQGNLSNAQKSVDGVRKKITTQNSRLVEINDSLVKSSTLLEKIQEQNVLEEAKDELISSIANSKARGSSLKALVAENQESISTLESKVHSHDSAECPTCHSAIEPEAVISKLKNENKAAIDEMETLKSSINEENSKLQVSFEQLKERSTLESAITSLEKNKNEITVLLSELEDELILGEQELSQYSVYDSDGAKQKLTLLDGQKREIVSQGEQIATTEKLITKMNGLIEERDSILSNISPSLVEKESLENNLLEFGDLNDLEEKVSDSESMVNSLRSRYDESSRQIQAYGSQKAVLEERMKAAQATLEKENALASVKTIALKRLEEKSAVSDLLDEYRKERVGRIAPELSDTATDLISQMTDGRFISVIVKEDFSTYVLKDDGFEYSVAELSGGEKSVVALALRISIGSLITGENAGMLWLDEVLPAQDAGRRDAILNVLRSLPIQQIIMINHTHEAEDVVDQVVKISYDGTDSVIAE